jgi:hypothetical protein
MRVSDADNPNPARRFCSRIFLVVSESDASLLADGIGGTLLSGMRGVGPALACGVVL